MAKSVERMRYVPNLTTGSIKIKDDTLCQPCQEEDLEPRRAIALVNSIPMCHDCACVELDI